ncbi:MAG: outer membrane porin, OprD family [Flavobacteriales bacterium]|nr:outer membrane porin, OprD family [Flavobacteriales bacterium]
MRWSLLSLLVLLAIAVSAQNTDQDLPHSDSLRQGAALHDVIRKGTLEGRFRVFLMGTLNDGAPADYHAQAFGGSLGFASQRWKGFQFRMSGGYAFDLWSADLTTPDPITKQPNRYEIGLFDVTAPREDNQLAYLQLFQLNYKSLDEHTMFVLGRQEINTPFINPQDGRMQPTLAEGLWASHRTRNELKLEGGLLYGFSPRSTAGWYGAEQSFGLYPAGVGVNGRPSRYAGNTTSAGVAMAGAQWNGPSKLTFTAWEMLTANISNTAMLQVERGTRDDRWMVGAMAIRQDKVGSGGNTVDSLAYFQADASMAFSGRLRMNLGRFRWQLNYTRITADGRYLMPREWGRDPFYTFLPRERNEGLGDVHATTLNLIWRTKNGWRIQGDAGWYALPDVSNADLNKYAFPSYLQFGLNTQYQFKGDWKGLAIQFLNVAKLPANGAAYTQRQAMNKVDMFHTELIVNYAF